jgi:nicotinamide-nucleotide amidase
MSFATIAESYHRDPPHPPRRLAARRGKVRKASGIRPTIAAMPAPTTPPDTPAAVVLSIGDELVLGQTVDTNTAWLAERLARLGIMCLRHETVADDRTLIAEAFTRAATDAAQHGRGPGLVIATGGLGPTADDLSREALADALGVELAPHEPSRQRIADFFAKLGRRMPPGNTRQAMCPIGATMIRNDAGTAPGVHARLHGSDVTITPGVPREMRWMFEQQIEPTLRQTCAHADGEVLKTTKITTFGFGESDAAERLGDLMARDRNPTVGTTVAEGLCSIRIRARACSAAEADAMIEADAQTIENRLGPVCFGRGDTSLQTATVEQCRASGITLATAESCTGGLLGGLLTDVPGSSAVYRGGWVTYTNDMKTQQLGVPPELLAAHGAVSAEVAAAMAQGARQRSDADVAVALTGIAGPDGGTDAKPVGTVWIALTSEVRTQTYLARLHGSRTSIRDRAAKCALQLIRFHGLGEDAAQIQWVTPHPAAKRRPEMASSGQEHVKP